MSLVPIEDVAHGEEEDQDQAGSSDEDKNDQTLRNIPTSDRYFWKDALADQRGLVVKEKQISRTFRQLPGNELIAMALNEVAFSRGRGFFLHLRNRDSHKTPPSKSICPTSRAHTKPGWVSQPLSRVRQER